MYSARDWQVREMRIVFINPSLRPDAKRRQLPVGLAYIMTAVKRAGFEFDLIDMDINNLSMQDLEDMLGKTMYDVYAFGCIVTGFRFVRQIAEICKNRESSIDCYCRKFCSNISAGYPSAKHKG